MSGHVRPERPVTFVRNQRSRWSGIRNLPVNVSFATIENAAKSRIWTAVSVYVLLAIVRERRNLYRSVDELLQMWRLNEVEKTPLDMLVSRGVQAPESQQPDNQRILFE